MFKDMPVFGSMQGTHSSEMDSLKGFHKQIARGGCSTQVPKQGLYGKILVLYVHEHPSREKMQEMLCTMCTRGRCLDPGEADSAKKLKTEEATH